MRNDDRVRRYGFAVLAILMGGLVSTIPIVREGPGTPAIVAFFLILLSAWYGGLGPGLLATGLIASLSSRRPAHVLEGCAARPVPRRGASRSACWPRGCTPPADGPRKADGRSRPY